MKQPASSKETSQTGLLALPEDMLQRVFKSLSNIELKSVAATHRELATVVRKTRRTVSCSIDSDNATAQRTSQLLEKYPALVVLHVHVAGPTLNFRFFHAERVFALEFCNMPPLSARGLTALTRSFPRLKELSINDHPILEAPGGCLSALSALASLTSLSLLGVATDEGLEHLTQLRALCVGYPDTHGDRDLEEFLCENCGEIHPEEVDGVLLQVSTTTKPCLLGSHLCRLRGLESLTLDFDGHFEVGLNPCLNVFQWDPRGCLPALRTLRLQGLGVGRCPAFRVNWGTARTSADAVQRSGAGLALEPQGLARLFDAMPELREVEVALPCVPPGPLALALATKSGQPLHGRIDFRHEAGEVLLTVTKQAPGS